MKTRDKAQRHREASRRYTEKNRDKIRKKSRKYAAARRASDPDGMREYRRKWYAKNTEGERARNRAWYSKNAGSVSGRMKKYYAENADVMRKKSRNYYYDNYGCWRKHCGIPEPTRPPPLFCECCGGPPERRFLCVDHCHITGKFRGWLCIKCNAGMGQLGDSIRGLQRAIDYLKWSAASDNKN